MRGKEHVEEEQRLFKSTLAWTKSEENVKGEKVM
jgi:hypothetical protein